jgi:hypothetical protein
VPGQETLFAFLPYLTTSSRFVLRGIEFRATSDLDDLAEGDRLHLQKLASRFYLVNDYQAHSCVCALITLPQSYRAQAVLDRMHEAQIILGFVTAVPDRGTDDTFLKREHSTIFLFKPAEFLAALLLPSPGAERSSVRAKKVQGYEGLRDWLSHLWVGDSTRIYPALPQQLRLAQEDLTRWIVALDDPRNWALRKIAHDHTELSDVDRQLLKAMEWHNASTAELVSEEERLVRLAIAFECLFGLERGEVLSRRIRETVGTILGRAPLLDSWVEQFYQARSQIVHQGASHDLRFHPVPSDQLARLRKKQEEVQTFGALTAHGRVIFRLCANALLSGHQNAACAELGQALMDDMQRLQKICELLDGKAGTAESRLRSTAAYVRNLHGLTQEAVHFVDEGALWGAVERVLRTFTAVGHGGKELSTALRSCIACPKRSRWATKLKRLHALNELLGLRRQMPLLGSPSEDGPLEDILAAFVNYAYLTFGLKGMPA